MEAPSDFDVNVGANPITVTGLETNTAETVAFSDLQVWVLAGQGGIGNELNPGLWTQVATGSGTVRRTGQSYRGDTFQQFRVGTWHQRYGDCSWCRFWT